MTTEKIVFSKIDELRNRTITLNNNYNDNISIACENFVTLSVLSEYDKRIKGYINSKINGVEMQERSNYFKRIMWLGRQLVVS